MQGQIDLLPEYLRFESVFNEEDGKRTKARKNATSMEHPVSKNKIIVKPKATSYDSALSVARGRAMLSQNTVMCWTNLFNCWNILCKTISSEAYYINNKNVQRLSKR